MDALISKQEGKVISFSDSNDLVAFRDAIKMLSSVGSFKNKIPSDWEEYRGGLELEQPDGDPKKAAHLVLRISNETTSDEPDLQKLYKIVSGFIYNSAFNVKETPMKENKRKQKIKEGLADLAASAEYDHEIQMARSELYKLSKYAIKLHNLLKNVSEEEGLQAWQQSYITKAADYIDAVYHDVEYEKSAGKEIDPAGRDQKIASIESKSYKKDLGKKLAEEIKFKTKASGTAFYKIGKKPGGYRLIVGFGGDRLTARTAEYESGDLRPDEIMPELEKVQRQLNVQNIEPYDEKAEKALAKITEK